MTAVLATNELTANEARALERTFLTGLSEAEDAFERILATQAWTQLGHETFADWWTTSVQPAMRSLSLRPQPALAAAVVDQVRAEEAALPPAQRRTQRELAEMVGVTQQAISSRSTQHKNLSGDDLGQTPEPVDAATETPPPGSGSTSAPAASPPSPGADPAPAAGPAAEHAAPRQEPAWSSEQVDLRKRLESGETVVVSLRANHADLVAWATERDLLVRVDRRTEWGNPFEMPADGDRGIVVAHYQWHYLPYKPSLMGRVQELKGKALACWCAPKECHADVLAELANGGEAS